MWWGGGRTASVMTPLGWGGDRAGWDVRTIDGSSLALKGILILILLM